jgi:4'-phosphopantetheinyl transferase
MTHADCVDVWTIPLDRSDVGLPGQLALLSPDERARAARFAHQRDRTGFAVARSALRSLLGRCVGRPPASLRFDLGEWGKPSLRDADGWRFNLSHSRSLAVLAVCRGRDLGIDIEMLRPTSIDIAQRYFARDEVRRIQEAVDPASGFYAHWTMKEAYLKATGEGLHSPLSIFSVVPGGRQQIGGFALFSCDSFPGFAAAVAVACAPDEALPPVQHGIWVG